MNVLESVILGIVQGLTEFIPVSSSGHLELIPKLLGWSNPTTVFDTFLHTGTLLALLFFFRKRISGYTVSLVKLLTKKNTDKKDANNLKVVCNVLIASIPAGIIGLMFEKLISGFYDSPENSDISVFLAICAMVLVGVIFLFIHKLFKNKKFELENLSARGAFFIGFAQIFAFFRGVSRSGITLIAGQFSGLKRVAAAEFAFLMSIPIIFATSIYSVYNILKLPPEVVGSEIGVSIAGMIAAFVSGVFAIKFLINFLKNNTLVIFGVYRIIFGIIAFVLIFLI